AHPVLALLGPRPRRGARQDGQHRARSHGVGQAIVTAPWLDVRGMSLVRRRRDVLRDVAFDVKAGEILAILGPNGAGRSALLESVAGVTPEARGEVRLQGTALTGFASRAGAFALMPDDAVLPEEASVALVLGDAASAPTVRELGVSAFFTRRAGRL